ncbi:MAG: heavy-metal-associated domain-containing protein [Flavobacteriaceae bacterium]|jgi:copper chaperone|nr:heavy-metal-associated domain-containing protein [Flavobacteriaceae bacterium]
MKVFKFKTNIDCGGCVNAVTPFLSKTPGISKWNVDTSNPDKILTVESEEVAEEDIINAVKKAGFNIEKI